MFRTDHIPSITLNMLVDFLEKYNIVSHPRFSKRVFRWFECPSANGLERPEGLRDGQILRICPIDEAEDVLRSVSHAFVCAILKPGKKLPGWVSPYTDRLVVIQPADSFMYILFQIQSYFISIALWEDDLSRASVQPDGLGRLLELGEMAIDSFVFCFDATNRVLAASPSIEPPSAELQRSVRARYLPKDYAAVDSPERIVHRIRMDGMLFATMVLEAGAHVKQGTRDLFELLCKHVDDSCKALWRNQLKASSPFHFFFTRLVDRKRRTEREVYTSDEIAIQLDALGIPHEYQLKLILFDVSKPMNPALSFSDLTNAARRINHGDCHCFVYEGNLCLLCYAVAGDSQLSLKKMAESVKRFVGDPFKIPSSASQIFDNIADLDFAYKQAVAARSLRSVLEKEKSSGLQYAKCDMSPYDLIHFDNCVLYYLVGAPERDERFLRFTFSHTLLQKIQDEDEKNGTDNLELIWKYLSCGRNATMVANAMDLHRNTVLYRIEKLEKRFDLDLSIKEARDKMILDYKALILMQSRVSLKQAFE